MMREVDILNQPGPLTALVGREAEAAAASAYMLRPDVRLITLTGPGGIGKTRLAIQVARQAAVYFQDGATFLSLVSVQSPALVMSVIGETFGLRDAGGSSLAEQLAAHLRPLQILLVLDNFEHLVEAGVAVSGLLAACPEVKCLVTSRVPLRISCEHQHPVPPLSLPAPQEIEDLQRLAQIDTVRLFLMRAAAARPDFQLTAANAAVIAAICARLEGLPLAVELAAALVRVLPLQAILARLDRRLHVLVGGPRDLPARQRTLRAAIAWSYNLLQPPEQRLFRTLAVLIGGISPDAIQAILANMTGLAGQDPTSSEEILAGLAALVDHSLLRQMAAEDAAEPRYAMLETIREYGLECLEAAGEISAARATHAGYFLSLAEAGAQGLRTGAQEQWLDRLEHEHDNLRAALGWLASRNENVALLRLCAALGRFWYMHGHLSEGRAWVEDALVRWEGPRAHWRSTHLERSLPESQRQEILALAGCLNAGGLMARYQSDYSRTVVLCEESLLYCRQLDDPRGITTALEHLAAVARSGGSYSAAQAMYAESLTICRRTGDDWGTAWTTLYKAAVTWYSGDLDPALALAQEALAAFRRMGTHWETAKALEVCAGIYRDRLDLQPVGALALEALKTMQRMGDRLGIALAHLLVADSLVGLGDLSTRLVHYREGIAIYQEVGSRNNYADAITVLAKVVAPWFPGRAVRIFAASEALYRVIGHRVALEERQEIDDHLARLRARLPEGQFAENWSAGEAMPPAEVGLYIQETIDLAMRETSRAAPAEPEKHLPYGLTAREIEVLDLVAGGMTDAQAAARLVISRRTVSTHMTSIFNKLGVSSRLAAVRLALDQKIIEGSEYT